MIISDLFLLITKFEKMWRLFLTFVSDLSRPCRLIKERESDPEGWYRFGREYSLYFDAIRELADFVKSDPTNLVLVENASTGTNSFFILTLFGRYSKGKVFLCLVKQRGDVAESLISIL